jgi:hypothetical protein
MLRTSLLRRFAVQKFVKAAEVEADANLKKYFDEKLQAWTLQYLTGERKRKEELQGYLKEDRRLKIEQLAKLVAFLPPDERWLVTEYVEQASLQDFIARSGSESVSQDFSKISECSEC